MRHDKVVTPVEGTQKISRMCFVCGEHNPLSLKAQFLNLADGRICATFITTEEHQSYPGRVHGGVISAILDEVIGRAIQVVEPDAFGVTIELNVHFRQPVPLGVPLKIIAELTEQKRQLFVGEGKLLLEDGTVAADAKGRYLRADVEQLSEEGLSERDWHSDPRDYPQEVEA